MFSEVVTCREMHGTDPPIGYEWDAGVTLGKNAGRFTVRLTIEGWRVVFAKFVMGQKEPIETLKLQLGHGEEFERRAKEYALSLLNEERSKQES